MAQDLLFEMRAARPYRDRELEQLVARYVRNLPAALALLKDTVQACDGRSARAIAHRLSGASGMYELWVLNEVANELYDDLESGEPVDGTVVRRHVSKLEEFVGLLVETIELPVESTISE